jgi:hypothetical protein
MSVVYFIRMGSDGPIKIGTALDVRKRLAALDCGPYGLELLGTVPGDQPLEKRIHRALVAHRLRHEWFRPDPEILTFVSLVITDPSLLPGLIEEFQEQRSAHLAELADAGVLGAAAVSWAITQICRREGLNAVAEQACVVPDMIAKYRAGTAKMSVVTLGRLMWRWPDDFALFDLVLDLPHLSPEEVRANRATLENARDAIEAQLAKLVKAA